MRKCKSDCKNCVKIDGDLFAYCFTSSFIHAFDPFIPFPFNSIPFLSLSLRFPFFISWSLFSLLLNAHVIASFQSKNHNLIYIQLNIPMYCCFANARALCWKLTDCRVLHIHTCMRTRVAFEIDVKPFNEYNFRRKFHLITQWNQWINVAKAGCEKVRACFIPSFFARPSFPLYLYLFPSLLISDLFSRALFLSS